MNVLIVDDENEIAEIIEFVIQEKFPGIVKVFFANSVSEATSTLSSTPIDLCICDHILSEKNGLDVLKFIIAKGLKTKFIICSSVDLNTLPEPYPAEHLFFHIIKPEIFEGISKIAEMISVKGEEEEIVAKVEYIPVSLDLLYYMEKKPSDVYVKINDETYLECLNRNEALTIEEKNKYQDKDIEYLYFKKTNFQLHIDQAIFNELEKLMLKIELSLSERMCIAHTQLTKLIKSHGITPDLAQATKEHLKLTSEFILKANLADDIWNNLDYKAEYQSHVYVLHALLASVILKKLKMSIETSIFKVTMAAFFEDILLDNILMMKLYDHNHFLKNEQNFDRNEKKIYLEHPQKTRELIANIQNIPPEVDKLIIEHHEMPDENGFPKKLNATKLEPLSCLFIISGILSRYILEQGPRFQMSKFIEVFESRGYAKGNFKDAFSAIKKLQKPE